MHELGHNLDLHHGGADDIHYKPNYLSVMNYLFQIPSETSNLFTRPLTYSSIEMDILNENNLNENHGVGTANWAITVYSAQLQTTTGIKYVPIAISTLSKIDWNNNGDETDTMVTANINNFPDWNYTSPPNEPLRGHNDWANLVYRFRPYSSFADGVRPNVVDQELTFELAEKIKKATENLVVADFTPISLDDENVLKFDLSSRATFLRAEPFDGRPAGGSPVEAAFIIDLMTEGFKEGDSITISYSGEVYYRAFWDNGDLGETYSAEGISLLGLFSASEDLKPIDDLHRVPGAIDYGEDVITEPTYFQQYQTDIPEDFRIEPYSGATIQIPKGAKYLFLSFADGYYPDNVGNINVSIQSSSQAAIPVELIITAVIVLIALLLIFFLLWKRKKKKDNNEQKL